MVAPQKIPRRIVIGFFVVVSLGLLLAHLIEPVAFEAFVEDDVLALIEGKGRIFEFFRDYGNWFLFSYVALIGAALFFENKNPDRTLAWLLVLGALPIVGILLYWIVGPNFRYQADKKRFRRRPLPPWTITDEKAPSSLVANLTALIYRSSGAPLLRNGSAKILVDGEETFSALLNAIASAKRSILIESYIVEDDALGRTFKDALMDRAQAGLPVCLIYDSVGSWNLGRRYIKDLRAAGVHVFAFLPVSFPMLRGANYRNHRKIAVIDGAIAFMGGLNISDDYLGRNPSVGHWRDTHIEIKGEGVAALAEIALNDLKLCGASPDVLALFSECERTDPADRTADGAIDMQIAASGPDTAWDTIQKAYFTLISRAQERVWITTPYLSPGDMLLNALCATSLSGVDVRILIPEKGDQFLMQWASFQVCEELLRAGVRIFLYDRKRFVHSKTIACDGALFSVGSANFDSRSLTINFEIQAFLYDEALAKQGEMLFRQDMFHARELTFSEWRKRSLIQKVKENIGKLFSPLL